MAIQDHQSRYGSARTELFNGQLHQQQPGGHPNVLASPLRDSPRVNLPSISKNPIDLSPSIPISRVYSHPDTSVYAASEDDDLPPRPVGSQPRVYSHPHTSVYVSSEDDDLPPRPRGSQTRVYSHPYAKSHLYSTSEDDDLPPRPKGSRKKVVSKAPPVGRKRSPSPPRRKNNLVQREFDFSDFQKFLFETDFDANRRLQYFVVPKDMYWPWKDEAEAHRQLFNAESNGFFSPEV
ncbi:hypothetical protein BKA64DRAFT_705803 [Cadophora sp. MPI-SDFR-AT-0126]|nr:hypothetical protein BKA64DRAFT_705803 [Leotiomycetes sp. MPI-SDFR-AT-0126]